MRLSPCATCSTLTFRRQPSIIEDDNRHTRLVHQACMQDFSMTELGQLLQQTRTEQKLTLADVETKTRIRQEYLAALEAGNWDKLPNPAVAKGFLRTYVRLLKLEDHPLVQEALHTEPVVAAGPAPANSYLPVEIAIEKRGWFSPRILRPLLRLVLILLPVAVLAWLLSTYALPRLLGNGAAPPTITTEATLPPAGAADSTPVILVGATPTAASSSQTSLPPTFTPTPLPTPAPTATPAPPTVTPSPVPIQKLELTIQVNQLSWLRVVTDGEVQLVQTLEPGSQQTFVAEEWIQVRVGNAAGVTIILNGRDLGVLGGPGEVIDYIWRLNGTSIERSTPTPEPTATPTPVASTELTSTLPITATEPLTETTTP